VKKIPLELVAELRACTGAGMMDCKKALEETDGDLEKAVDVLRQKGAAKADKRAGREASEGLIGSYVHHDGAIAALSNSTARPISSLVSATSRPWRRTWRCMSRRRSQSQKGAI